MRRKLLSILALMLIGVGSAWATVVDNGNCGTTGHESEVTWELDDEGVQEVIAKQVKMRKDALADFEKAGRTDLLDVYKAEIDILQSYLPEQLSEDEVRSIVTKAMEEAGIAPEKKNMGMIMKTVMPLVKGKADGGIVKKVVDSIINA